jgi:hypothetical protein
MIKVELSSIVADLWDGKTVKCTFRRSLIREMLNSWFGISLTIQSSEGKRCTNVAIYFK